MICPRNSCCVLSVHCVCTFFVLPLFLLALALFLFLLALLLVLFLRTPLVSSIARSFLKLLLRLLVLPPLLCLPHLLVPLALLLLPFGLIVFAGLLLRLLLRVLEGLFSFCAVVPIFITFWGASEFQDTYYGFVYF